MAHAISRLFRAIFSPFIMYFCYARKREKYMKKLGHDDMRRKLIEYPDDKSK